MSSPEAYDALVARLRPGWTTTDLVLENEDYEVASTPTRFVYVEIYGDNYNQESMGAPGANMWLETGVAYLHVMVPTGTGSREARALANSLLYLFREQPTGLTITEMSIGAGDPSRSFGNYFSIAATLFWTRFDITSIPTP
jgi:hypothetical protein